MKQKVGIMRIPGFQTIYIALLIAAAIAMIIAFFTGSVIDIHLHDTMFVISATFITALFFLFTSILYLANRRLIGRPGKSNLFLWFVLIAAWLMWWVMLYFIFEDPPPRRYLDVTSFQTYATYMLWVERIVMGVIIIFLFSQLAFWLYFIARIISGLIKRRSQGLV